MLQGNLWSSNPVSTEGAGWRPDSRPRRVSVALGQKVETTVTLPNWTQIAAVTDLCVAPALPTSVHEVQRRTATHVGLPVVPLSREW